MRPRRTFSLALFVVIFTAIVLVARYGIHDGAQSLDPLQEWVRYPHEKGLSKCAENLGWLEPYQFTYPIQYASRDIFVNPTPSAGRPSLTVVNEPLFDDFVDVDITKSPLLRGDRCLPALVLDVAHGSLPPVDASNMIFGLQTTLGRLADTVKHFERWLPHTNARLYAIVLVNEETPANDTDIRALEKEFREKGIDATLMHPVQEGDRFEQRYFSLVSVMYQARTAATQWITLIDDDTFFPSMHDLQAKLSRYDPSEQHYIGSLSEDWWAVNHYRLMGFGGAGIFLSVPMAQVIDENNDECKAHPSTTAGDVTVMDCIYRFSPTKLEHVPALHQVDMHGDLSGFYESGRAMLSLHHWKADYKLEIEKMHLVADICDSCFLQRWQFPEEIVLSNGFSINQYPRGRISGKKGGLLGTGVGGDKVEKINLEEMEATWEDINVLHSLAPTRPKLEGEKTSYKLLDSFIVDGVNAGGGSDRVVRQVYLRELVEGEQDTVLVLNWRNLPKELEPPMALTITTALPEHDDGP